MAVTVNEKTPDMERIQSSMGWTDTTLFQFVLNVLAVTKLTDGFEDILRTAAAEDAEDQVTTEAKPDWKWYIDHQSWWQPLLERAGRY